MQEKKHQRCISQLMMRERYKLDYEQKIISLKKSQEEAIKNLKDLEKNYENVIQKKALLLK